MAWASSATTHSVLGISPTSRWMARRYRRYPASVQHIHRRLHPVGEEDPLVHGVQRPAELNGSILLPPPEPGAREPQLRIRVTARVLREPPIHGRAGVGADTNVTVSSVGCALVLCIRIGIGILAGSSERRCRSARPLQS
ncbi:hypothetical protein PybrP1_001332 [[Pythium] brassicae (nom. inval.)]|nr:hypothetical protein PybrP1_001332 [[Pythium] brassicae (nom. inval.)]